jgi:hypothetical protein
MSGHLGTKQSILALGAVAVLAGWTPQAVLAQDYAHSSWLAWYGCWQPEDAPADAPMTCVRPGEAGGVELLTVTADGVVETRPVRADGTVRQSTVGDCVVAESAEFSADGARVFFRGERACADDATRRTSSLLAMVAPDRWIEVQAMEMGGRSVVWVDRYMPAARVRVEAAGLGDLLALVDARSSAVRAARMAASGPITVNEVIEAVARADAEAVSAWVAEQYHTIPLNTAALLRLADAGVPDEVIDVVVAVAYPDRFAVAHASPRDAQPRPGVRRPYPGMYPGIYDPYWGSYGWGRGWGPYYGRGGTVIVVTPRDGERTSRAVKGSGYTRGTGGSGTGATTQAPATSTGSTGSTVRQTPPSSSGGSSTPPARTAKPRGGGD